MLYSQQMKIFANIQNPLRSIRISRDLLFHKSSTVTFQASYQDNEHKSE